MRVVVFTKDGARIYKNPPDVDELKKLGPIVIDPDFSALKSTPPHLWRHESGEIFVGDAERPKLRIQWKKHLLKAGLFFLSFVLGLLF